MKFKENYEMKEDGRLVEDNLKSEYERGYVDCWNENFHWDEEPLKGYRQWVWESLSQKAQQSQLEGH